MKRLDHIFQSIALKVEGEIVNQKIESLSGGEKNMLQLANVSASKANVLLLDEPTSHLDTYTQIALEKAIENQKGNEYTKI